MLIEILAGQFQQQREKQREKRETIKYVVDNLNKILDDNYKKSFENKIKKMYDKEPGNFQELKNNVDMLMSILTAANMWIKKDIKSKKDIKKEIQKYKQKIAKIIGKEIQLVQPVEKFLLESDAEK